MGSFVITYSLVWLAVVFYVARLGHRQRQLQRDLNALRSRRQMPNQLPVDAMATRCESAA